MLEDAARPGAGRLGIGAHGDAPALEVFRRHRFAAIHISDGVVLEAADDGGGEHSQRLTVGLGLQAGDDRELAGIERAVAHHRLEAVACDRRPAEIKADDRRRHPAVLQGGRERAVGEVMVLERDRAAGRIRCCHGALSCC